MYSQQVDGAYDTTALAAGKSRQFKLKFSCLCASIDKLLCFSKSLNCVIIQRAFSGCSANMDFDA